MRRIVFAIAVFASLPACEPMPTETKQVISDWRSGKPDADCEIPGESGQWMADYCLAAVQTDDLVAAQPCMDHERKRHHGEECATRREYKQGARRRQRPYDDPQAQDRRVPPVLAQDRSEDRQAPQPRHLRDARQGREARARSAVLQAALMRRSRNWLRVLASTAMSLVLL